MSGVFDLRKLPLLEVLVVVKLRDRSLFVEAVSEYIAAIADLSLSAPDKLLINQLKMQILILDSCVDRPLNEKSELRERLKNLSNVSYKTFGPFRLKRDETIATYTEVFRFPFAILVELPSLNAWSARNVLELVRPVVDGSDFVVGQRSINLSLMSLMKLKAMHGFFWLRFGYPVKDWTSEYLAWRHWAISNAEPNALLASGMGFLAELKNRCLDKGFRSQSVKLIGDCPPGEFEFLQGIQPLSEIRGIRSTI
jgi:hypothetical protein